MAPIRYVAAHIEATVKVTSYKAPEEGAKDERWNGTVVRTAEMQFRQDFRDPDEFLAALDRFRDTIEAAALETDQPGPATVGALYCPDCNIEVDVLGRPIHGPHCRYRNP